MVLQIIVKKMCKEIRLTVGQQKKRQGNINNLPTNENGLTHELVIDRD